MMTRPPKTACLARRAFVVIAALIVCAVSAPSLHAQVFQNTRSVGGVWIDPSGLMVLATIDGMGELSRQRTQWFRGVSTGFQGAVGLRKISLRRLGETIAKHIEDGKPLPQEIECLGGLQQIRYVFVYPEQQDIVLVGPAEGWKADAQGMIVGRTTGRPVMLLDDLLVALRTARGAANGGMSCSIDPTEEGLARLRAHRFPRGIDPSRAGAIAQKLMGPQQITFTGIPDTSHFARVLIAADYQMKRLGMGLDKSPVARMPSYMAMIGGARRGSIMSPRWWLEPNYEPLLKSPDGLAWELRGGSVKTMTEDETVAADGRRTRTGRSSPAAKKWADTMTEKYDELSVAQPIFGQLRNCMELAIVGALINKENLTEKAGYSMPVLLDPTDLKTVELPAPKKVDSVASVYDRVMSVSGGVLLNTWAIADKVQQSDAPVQARAKAAPEANADWWWD